MMEYRWEDDWPRITIEWPEIGRVPDGIVSRPVYAKEPRCYYQADSLHARVEITREHYDRLAAEWKARLELPEVMQG